jgi:hypothetical protein
MEEAKLCPSAACSESANLLGIVQGNNTVALLDMPVKINNAFVKEVNDNGTPEKYFRFTDKCIKAGCKQWTGKSCGIINELANSNPHIKNTEDELPDCFIRSACRWYSQEGGKACKICLFVITDSSSNE